MRIPAVLPLACFAVAFVACDGPPATVTAPPTVGPTPAPSGPAGFAGAKARGSLRIAADVDAPPFLGRDTTGTLEGFEYALMTAMADRAGVPLKIVESKFDDLATKVTSGEADLAIGQMSPSSSYDGLAFSVSYLQYSLCLIVPKDSKVKTLPDLKGKRVAMYDDPVARQLSDVLIGASYDRQLFDDYGYFEKMTRGQLDAMVYDCPLARYEMKVYGDSLRVADDALNVTTYNVAVRADDKTMLQEVNGVLKELGNNGLLEMLQTRWLGAPTTAEDFETATGKVCVVRKGDTLGVIAERELGAADRWKEIFEKNADVIGPDADLIYVGMRLRVPKK